MNDIITGKVVKISDENNIVINKGAADGVTLGNRFLIYSLGEELFDPDTKESLGTLEIVCGEGKPTHIQEHMTTVTSDRYETRKTKTIVKRNSFFSSGEVEETYDPETVQLPFENVEVGTLVRQIR